MGIMQDNFFHKVKKDLKESQITWKVSLLLIPIAFTTYIFHEFGHWMFGELLGNDMAMGLNFATPRNGYFIKESHALWSAIGGPLFTIIQALVFLLITWLTKSIFAYSVVFFAVFSRFYSIVFGGIDLQDEARIAFLLDTNKYLIASVVLSLLFLILWRCNRLMNLNTKAVGYFTVLGTLAILVVIGLNAFITIQ